jgi:hypothetical protein
MIDYSVRSLDEQHAAFIRHKFLAMPIAGTIAWAGIGIAGAVLPLEPAAWAVFIGTGMIFSLGIVVAKFTGEDLLGRESRGNYFDTLFFHTVAMALLVYGIAIPFFLVEPISLPMAVGILSGLMWVPLSALINHWVGLFHGSRAPCSWCSPTSRFPSSASWSSRASSLRSTSSPSWCSIDGM